MSRIASILAVAIGCGSMAWGYWGIASASAVTWTASWLDAAWIGGGLLASCAGGYVLGMELRSESA